LGQERSPTLDSRIAGGHTQTAQYRSERLSDCTGNDEFAEEIRQMIVGRYRVLFTIQKGKVHVLHIRGAYGF
jgi:hypothetical protein